ncbi:hypothetical protein Rruber_00403 [Rhodococcus ruber]|uniref:lysophospholipase n=1 Tax=Rhodococcus ruber TaxID=1830 RepID=UPI00315DC747
MTAAAAPHRIELTRPVHRGEFWLESGDAEARTLAYVRWESPGRRTDQPPVVLVHGGGGQSTDWSTTPNGDPGWARLLVDAGHPVYLPDRPAHGRSPYRPAVHGPQLPAATAADLQQLFTPTSSDARHRAHTQWPWAREPGHRQFDALAAASQPMLLGLVRGHRADGEMLIALLERIGPAIVITHSAGAPAGWIAAQRHPDLVTALVAIEPLGPPFRDMGARGRLDFGLAAVPLDLDTATTPDPAQQSRPLRGLASTAIAVVSADASGRQDADLATVAFLRAAGAAPDHLVLAECGLTGYGHGLIFENGHDAVLSLVRAWLEPRSTPPSQGMP